MRRGFTTEVVMLKKARLGTLLVTSALLPAMLFAQSAVPHKPTDGELRDAYVYILGRALVIRQELNDVKDKGAGYNVIKYNPLGSADFVNPNFDVAYLEAWFAVDKDSANILEVPEIDGRYYTAQILDEWAEVIVNINERTMASKPYGKFALALPRSTAKIPHDATPIYLRSPKAKMLARVELKGESAAAEKLQKAFKVTTVGKATVQPPAKITMFDNKELAGVEIFDHVDRIFASAIDVAPNASSMQEAVRRSRIMPLPARRPGRTWQSG